MKIQHTIYALLAVLMSMASCTATHENAEQVDNYPLMFPVYTDVTIPVNIAPLNFMIRDVRITDMETVLTIDGKEENSMTVTNSGNVVRFDGDDWKDFLQKAAGKTVSVQIYSRNKANEWTQYKPLTWEVVGDSIDPYLTYQLIDPDYKVWSNIQIKQRCVENFREKILADHNLQQNKCMNCHILGNQDPKLSMLYLNEDGRDAILNRNGRLRRLNIKTDEMESASEYYDFSPSGKYIAFSTNSYLPAFHANPDSRIEVYDTKSDVYVANLDNNTISTSPLTSSSQSLETFPAFSPDGKYIYYCSAHRSGLSSKNLKSLKYALVRIPFDEATGKFGNHVDTLYTARSVCLPRISPDGKYCLFTVADYGTCPAWHPEADLCLLNLQTGKIDSLKTVNSNKSDTYHSWSHNSRWFVFLSKRYDGLYSWPYFCYIDRQGKAHRPFLLPQKDPSFYDDCLKCFNIPEMSRGAMPFDAIDIENTKKEPIETFKQQ